MAATSLAEQLKRLSVPQTTIFRSDKKKASLLFDPKEAALKDRDTFYEIGVSGLQELISLYEGFRVFEDTLFNQSSKDFERAVQTKEANENLDKTIRKFLCQVSPYLLLQSSHKALEWLVNRYHIHQYNQEAIMAMILPYHETKIFVRFIQLMNFKSNNNQWMWLMTLQKPGVTLSKQVLYNQCSSNPGTLRFIAQNTSKYVKEFGDRASQLKTVFAFFCSTTIGTIDTAKEVSEGIVNAILPTVMKALNSSVIDFRSSAYVILGFLTSKAGLKENIASEIIDSLMSSEEDLSYDTVLLTNLIYNTQLHLEKVSDAVLYNLSADTMNTLCSHLKRLVELSINVRPFILKFLSSILPVVQADSEEFMRFSQFPEILIDSVDLTTQEPENILQCIINCYNPARSQPADDESDIEIIEEDYAPPVNVLHWYSSLLKSFETKYPEAFDNVVKENMRKSGKKLLKLTKLLNFKPEIAHRVGDTTLFENLNHVSPSRRIQAVKYIAGHFETLTAESLDFVRESIINRFNDDDAGVVLATLKIPTDNLQVVFNEADLADVFVKIISRDLRHYKKWKPVVNEAVCKFCMLKVLPVTQDIVLAVMPLLFPYDARSAAVTWNIIHSVWGKKFALTKNIAGLDESIAKDNHEMLTQVVFKSLQKTSDFNFMDDSALNKENTLDVCFYLLLKTCRLNRASIEDVSSTLRLVLESLEHREIVQSADASAFDHTIVSEMAILARQGKILFEFMHFMFAAIVDGARIGELSKPWCDVCRAPAAVLARRLYEIFLTGCFIPTYSANYTSLLQQLLGKVCDGPREKAEFVANIACGHFLFAADPKDVIGPELQLRSLKVLQSYIAADTSMKWLIESDVILLMVLFNLNNPLMVVRQMTINIVEAVLNKGLDKSDTMIVLLQQLYERREELVMDHEQIPQILDNILGQTGGGGKEFKSLVFKRKCLQRLMSVLEGDTPAYVKSEFLRVLSQLNNASVFTRIVPTLTSLQKTLKSDTSDKFAFDIYESKLMCNVFARINAKTVSTLEDDNIWRPIESALKEYRECVLDESQSLLSPCVLVMSRIDEDVFKKVDPKRATELTRLICSAGAFANNSDVAAAASKTMKKLHLEFGHFKPILEGMLNAPDPVVNASKKSKASVAMLSHQLAETQQWRLGITLLEYVQSKKRMSVDANFVSLLFKLLSRCLRFEDQSYVEYTKQLILSSLWYYCKRFLDHTNSEEMKQLKPVFDIEVAVKCIRGTQNPQTHHHALILLSHAAYLLPDQVLHHTMEIFTFMGSSVLRHDDAYSFQIITRIIETLVPILVKLDKSVEEYTESQLKELQKRVVPVLRIFADVVLHVPEHRRLPLYRKLIETLGPGHFLWVFLALLLETHVVHFNDNKEKHRPSNRTLADREAPVNRLDFGQSIVLEFPPEVGLETFIKLVTFVKSLPLFKDENSMETDVDQTDIFSVSGHTPLQLRHYKYIIITFMNTCLASSRFVQHSDQATNIPELETQYKSFIVNILTFIQSISKVDDEKTAKYWRVMLHHSYDLLDNTNNMLSPNMFLSVVRGLMRHNLETVKRKSMELLNSKIQHSPEFFNSCDQTLLFSLLPSLLDIVRTIETGRANESSQELELNQQTALLSLKLLTRMLATDHPDQYESVLEVITGYVCTPGVADNVMASIVLCLAELCGNLKARALVYLRKFMPALIKVLRRQRETETPELILLSTVTAITKIVESLPSFLSPYMQKILYEYSILLAKWQTYDQECSKVSAIVAKLMNIKKKVATSIPPRVLIPVVSETHRQFLEKRNFDAIGPLMAVLADSFANVTTADFAALQHDLTSFFLSALQLRSDTSEVEVELQVIDKAEEEIVNALVCLVLKLSESNFRPFYFRLYDWAIRTNVDDDKDRTITFYRLSSAIAEKLKGLFVLFAGHFIKNASELLDACNTSKTETLFFDSDQKCLSLVAYILKTLQVVFLYDTQNFVNKDRFEVLMQSIVDQLENTLGGITDLQARAKGLLIPCIAQFAVATADDSLWKLLNYQILLKTRHNDAEIRLTALECLVSTCTQLGSSWLPLVAESVPFLAELLEDGDVRIEGAAKQAIRTMEQVLGEPLEKYF